jgi:hypothetical protein
MQRGLAKVTRRVRALAAQRKARFTLKALRELATLDLDATDACEVIEALKAADFVERLVSDATGEWMYVFKPRVAETLIYLKLVLQDGCLVVSFHADEARDEEEGR